MIEIYIQIAYANSIKDNFKTQIGFVSAKLECEIGYVSAKLEREIRYLSKRIDTARNYSGKTKTTIIQLAQIMEAKKKTMKSVEVKLQRCQSNKSKTPPKNTV